MHAVGLDEMGGSSGLVILFACALLLLGFVALAICGPRIFASLASWKAARPMPLPTDEGGGAAKAKAKPAGGRSSRVEDAEVIESVIEPYEGMD